MGAGYVEIGEVCAIRFVEVVVTFHQGGLRSSDYREEECGRRDCRGDVGFAEEAVSEDGIEDTELRMSNNDEAGGENYAYMPRKWNILEICKDEKRCYYPGRAAWSGESV